MTPHSRAWFLGALLAMVAGFSFLWTLQAKRVLAEGTLAGNPRDLYRLVESQVAAFRQNDFTLAYTFAASGIRQKFSEGQFSEMVRATYPQLTQAGRLNFGETRFAADVRASALIYVSQGRKRCR